MIRILFVSLLTLVFGACKSYVQLVNTSSSLPVNTEGLYMFENDSLILTYGFWGEHGVLSFSIFNKLSVPLYVDWKKSSLINNTTKLNYWSDEQSAVHRTNIYQYSGIRSESTVSIYHSPERITFIPPNSKYSRASFYIWPGNIYSEKFSKKESVPLYEKSRIMTDLYIKSFSKSDSPITFRNFLTFSFNESFDSEFYVDNEFFVSEIIEMERRHFEETSVDNHNRQIVIYKFMNPRSFYLRVPQN